MIENTEELKNFVLERLEDRKAENITVIDLGDNVALAKYLIIATGRSTKNISAMADFLSLEVKNNSKLNISLEGLSNTDWVLVDLGDIIVHLFHPEARARYKLEELWSPKI